MNQKYHISVFIEDKDLVIKCDTLKQARKAGKYLWPNIGYSISQWLPNYDNFSIIAWYSKLGTNFNPTKSKYYHQTIVNFQDVIFDDEKIENYTFLIDKLNELNIK